MSDLQEKRFYVIPKHVEAKLTLFGMDTRGWMLTAFGVLLALGDLYLGISVLKARHLNSIMATLSSAFFIVAISVLIARSSELLSAWRRYRRHRRTAKVLRLEVEPNAVITCPLQKRK